MLGGLTCKSDSSFIYKWTNLVQVYTCTQELFQRNPEHRTTPALSIDEKSIIQIFNIKKINMFIMSLNCDEALKAYFLSRFHYPDKLIPTAAYPRNWAPEGPTSISLLARPSPSTMGGMLASRCLLTSLHVTRVGALHFRGGMRSLRPLWRHPRMAPPRASTMKLTKKLHWGCTKLKCIWKGDTILRLRKVMESHRVHILF